MLDLSPSVYEAIIAACVSGGFFLTAALIRKFRECQQHKQSIKAVIVDLLKAYQELADADDELEAFARAGVKVQAFVVGSDGVPHRVPSDEEISIDSLLARVADSFRKADVTTINENAHGDDHHVGSTEQPSYWTRGEYPSQSPRAG